MTNFVKIQAQQSTISTSQDLIDFQIPQHLQGVDMSKSFINIKFRITEDPSVVDGTPSIFNYALKFNGVGGANAPCSVPNSALVRNCFLTSSRAGQLESIRRADLYSTVKKHYSNNFGDMLGDQSKSISQLPQFGVSASPCGVRNLLTEGSIMSSNENTAFRVDLKDFLGLGESVLNLNQLGNLRLHIEANLNKFSILPIPVVSTAGDATSNFDNLFQMRNLNITNPVQPTTIDVVIDGANNVTGGDALLNRSSCPYYVGQQLGVVLAPVTDALLQQTVIITGMEWLDSSDGIVPTTALNGQIVRLTLNRSYLSNNSTVPITGLNIQPIVGANPVLEYLGAEIVLSTTSNPPKSKGIMYRTIRTQEDHAPPTTNFQSIYQLPQNAISNLICFDSTSTSTDFSYSYDHEVSQYQLFVDNIPLTDRPVNINTTNADGRIPSNLHGIMLEKCLDEMGIEFKNYTECLTQPLIGAGTDINFTMIDVIPNKTNDIGVLVLPAILPATNGTKLFQVNITKTASTDMNLVLFQMVEKVINF